MRVIQGQFSGEINVLLSIKTGCNSTMPREQLSQIASLLHKDKIMDLKEENVKNQLVSRKWEKSCIIHFQVMLWWNGGCCLT